MCGGSVMGILALSPKEGQCSVGGFICMSQHSHHWPEVRHLEVWRKLYPTPYEGYALCVCFGSASAMWELLKMTPTCPSRVTPICAYAIAVVHVYIAIMFIYIYVRIQRTRFTGCSVATNCDVAGLQRGWSACRI